MNRVGFRTGVVNSHSVTAAFKMNLTNFHLYMMFVANLLKILAGGELRALCPPKPSPGAPFFFVKVAL